MENSSELFQRSKVVVSDHFVVEDLFDFPNDDEILVTEDILDIDIIATGNSTDSSFSGSNNNNNINQECLSQFASSDDIGCRSFTIDGQFSSEFSVPYDAVAELEWLSNFVEESFSSDDLQKLHLSSGMKARSRADEASAIHHQCHSEPNRAINSPIFMDEISVPAKARSKRPRATPSNWESRLMIVSPSTMSSSSKESNVTSNFISKKKVKTTQKKKDTIFAMTNNSEEGRKCLHCATDKTPQWRTGPMGPKTLCNACGVRYKSGRLVPEYRPAASPTFVLTKHSNSHRKVVEIRRQKELLQVQQQFLHHNMMFDVSNVDNYLIHQHISPHFRQLI